MTTVLVKTHTVPVIAAVRLTCSGDQYTVETPEYVDIVTVTGSQIACTCHEANCDHVRTVNRRRAQDAARDARRIAYEELFDLGYGDIVA